MTRFVHPLLLLIARYTDKKLAQLVEYLLTENRCMRSKLPKRIEVTPVERAKLIKLGKPLGSKLKDIISIVSYRTFT
jgi:putative transposase